MLLRDTIFIVDGSADSRATLRKTFESRFNILEAGNLAQAELLFRDHHPFIAAMLLDMTLVAQAPAEAIRWLDDAARQPIPRIAVVDVDDVQNEHRAFHLGATDVIFRPLHSATSERRVYNLIELFRSKWKLEEMNAEQAVALRHTNEAMVDALSSVIEGRSVESGQHVLRIRRFTQALLEVVARACPEYGLTDQDIQSIASAAALHDIGKIAIPDAILNKPGKLTVEEYAVMQTHTTQGAQMLERIHHLGSEDYLRYAYNICLYHHERWKGEGYPKGLTGEDIPICAQVVGMADCYDALMTERVYKPAYPSAEAASMILNGDCGSFSPVLLECFKQVRPEWERIAAAYADGHLPQNDAIRAPLDPPVQSSVGSLQKMVNKYAAILRYLGATVIDIDLDKRIYHVAHSADADFEFIRRAGSRKVTFTNWARNVLSANGQGLSPDRLFEMLEAFFASGLRQRSFSGQLKGEDGTVSICDITLLRGDMESENRIATLICKKREPGAMPADQDRLAATLLELVQPCLYDQWLTMPRISNELVGLLGYSAGEIAEQFGSRLLALVPAASRGQVRDQLRQQLTHAAICELEMPLQRKDGRVMWVMSKGVLVTGAQNIEQLYLVFADVTESRKMQDTLQQALSRQELIVAQTNDIVFELDFQKDELTISPKWEERFGYKPISRDVTRRLAEASHFHPDDGPVFLEKMQQLKTGTSFVEFPLRVSDITGRYRWSRVRAALQTDSHGGTSKAVGVFIDLDSELSDKRHLSARADRDSLTKLYHKDACRREVESYLTSRKGDELAVLAIIDLDNFKEVNDRYGHLFGDTVLARAAGEISRMFRGTDVLGRIGGDEFLVFLPQVTGRGPALDRFQILIEAVQRVLDECMLEGDFSCSVGIAFAPDHGTAYEELFQRADRALYQAKALGKGRYCVYDAALGQKNVSTAISKRIDSDAEPGLGGDSLVQYVFDRLYESGDTEGTIRSLLEIVGEQLKVSRVYIFENDPEGKTCSNTFEWCNQGIEPQMPALQNISYEEDIPGFREMFNEHGIFYSHDVTQLPDQIRAIVEPQGIRSILACAIRDGGRFLGYVGIDEDTRIRLWNKDQIEMLRFLSQILSLFLLKHRSQQRSDRLVQDLRNLLDLQKNCIYVVDQETSRLRFLNGKLLELEPDAREGMLCYEALGVTGQPCDICPVRAGGSCVIHNKRRDLHLTATAGSIHWEEKPAWVISCQNLP